jgi:CheY-like chemotaxis protein
MEANHGVTDRGGNPRHVLVIDDEPDFAALMEAMIHSLGYHVSVAYNGEEALASVRASVPDAITLDLGMPEKSGLMFYREMKSVPAYRRIPVIIATGRRRNRDWEYFIDAFLKVGDLPPPDAYVDKPVTLDKLREALTDVLALPDASVVARQSVGNQ